MKRCEWWRDKVDKTTSAGNECLIKLQMDGPRTKCQVHRLPWIKLRDANAKLGGTGK